MHPDIARKKVSVPLYKHVIIDHKATVESIAAETGLAGSTIYGMLENEKSIKMEHFPQFYQGANRPVAALKAFVACCDPDLAVVSLADTGEIDGSLTDKIEDIIIRFSRFVEDKCKALADDNIDDEERGMLIDDLLELRSTNDRLIEEVKHYGKKPETGIIQYKGGNHLVNLGR